MVSSSQVMVSSSDVAQLARDRDDRMPSVSTYPFESSKCDMTTTRRKGIAYSTLDPVSQMSHKGATSNAGCPNRLSHLGGYHDGT
jgi:hypothetical protein